MKEVQDLYTYNYKTSLKEIKDYLNKKEYICIQGLEDLILLVWQIYLQYSKWMRPQTKGHILYESTYMKYQEEANPETEVNKIWKREIERSYS